MCLNFKGIPFETEWVEYPDIESVCKAIGAAPTDKKLDGSPEYTVPVIKDTSTGTVLSESFEIAKYLDKTYVSTPTLFPPGTVALQAAFQEAWLGNLKGWATFITGVTFLRLNPASHEFFRKSREEWWGMKIEEMLPPKDSEKWKGEMAKIRNGFNNLDSWYNAGGTQFLTGDEITYADITVAAWVGWFKDILPEEWEEVNSWHGGKWETFVKEVRERAGY